MPSLCNSTLSSSPDMHEFKYWSSFSEKPFCCGDRLQVYKGKLNGRGPRGGDFSAVKVFADQPGTESRCCREVAKARTASEWLARFLARGQYRQQRVKVAQLQMAPLDQVSLLNLFFSHNRRRPSSGEWILLEEMVNERGALVQFVDRHGRMYRDRAGSGSGPGGARLLSGSPSFPRCRLNTRELLEAFVHFSHHASRGQLVICGLEGQEDDMGRVVLKTPVVHSRDASYGETDLGPSGIQEVMSRHVCNRHCRQVLGLQRSLSAWGDCSPLFPRQRRIPSAPFEEQDLPALPRCSPPSAPPYRLGELGLDVEHLPQDVFHPPSSDLDELGLFFHLELTKGVPDEPPPPYTEYIQHLM
ncbi:uncharacterized protein LOC143300731 [Babylonia areolata]|uniref:uncharacterized protein LOC143300731 n=1 Tax=Babylonia areolata TaxID=304850 RepID=UPI003FD018E2